MTSMAFEDFSKKISSKEIQQLIENFQQIVRQEFLNTNRPASEIVLDDVDLQKLLKISRRQTAYLREQKIINFSQPIPRGKIYYSLKDALDYINRGRVESIFNQRKF